MNTRTIFFLLLLSVLFPFAVNAQSFDPMAIKITDNGQEVADTAATDTIFMAGEMTGSAPMKVLFKANVAVPDGYTYFCEWYTSGGGDSNATLFRTEDSWEFTFDESGTFYYSLLVAVTKTDDGTVSELRAGDFVIKISESKLKVPNAFSPNGDGINDVFKVSYKSLVRFNAYVFNRWGQEIYKWGMSNIDEGWDGTAHGKPVKDGVYFIVVEAEGSDGIKYKHKGDINILRGYSGTGSTGNNSSSN